MSGQRDKPWVMRTYAGHSSAQASNELYRRNLEKGQTGLSVAFDLPTQTGYDPDSPLARGEVGKVGVPVASLADMRQLFDGIPLGEMNTSMTINAPAMWLLALYQVTAEEQAAAAGEDPAAVVHRLTGTTQNDIIKEYLSRGTYVFPPAPSLRLISDMIAYTVTEIPKWNPINICSYHLQEAGATPEQELAYAMCTAIAVLDSVRDAGQVPAERFGDVCARISFFVNAGVRFVEEMCKMRAFGRLWDELLSTRYGVADPRHRRFRYGVQVNSLGLTAGEQRDPDRARSPGRHPVQGRPRPRAPAPGVERGARAAPAVGSAVVAAYPADPGVRDRPARVRRPVRGLSGCRTAGGGARRRRAGRDRPGAGDGRRGGGR
jgi:ethylmalonyl-CoA mutase